MKTTSCITKIGVLFLLLAPVLKSVGQGCDLPASFEVKGWKTVNNTKVGSKPWTYNHLGYEIGGSYLPANCDKYFYEYQHCISSAKWIIPNVVSGELVDPGDLVSYGYPPVNGNPTVTRVSSGGTEGYIQETIPGGTVVKWNKTSNGFVNPNITNPLDPWYHYPYKIPNPDYNVPVSSRTVVKNDCSGISVKINYGNTFTATEWGNFIPLKEYTTKMLQRQVESDWKNAPSSGDTWSPCKIAEFTYKLEEHCYRGTMSGGTVRVRVDNPEPRKEYKIEWTVEVQEPTGRTYSIPEEFKAVAPASEGIWYVYSPEFVGRIGWPSEDGVNSVKLSHLRVSLVQK